ncbi:hypothetical protein OMP38_33875 [Cohnella ginsengisoli]|uniref:Uncharacterized protein n=1 Tax=Cohnella ginsengisoli TaxID=425004 RepID=A0A9X4KNK8_9BACL|nr:hypothetical protein [Cohnella ginsengisoli]MDG0795265.1 hypothetical protein [Cohnella ginsengisoli]
MPYSSSMLRTASRLNGRVSGTRPRSSEDASSASVFAHLLLIRLIGMSVHATFRAINMV